MRTFGPGSISSFLKTVLDVLYLVLWVIAVALAAAALGAILSQPFLVSPHAGPSAPGDVEGDVESLLRRGPALAAVLLAAGANAAALIVVADRLRRVFATMTAGDPFEPGNVGRLRTIALALLALQPAGMALSFALAHLSPRAARTGGVLDLGGLFAVLIVFVLAEVFREGARLRTEARLTV